MLPIGRDESRQGRMVDWGRTQERRLYHTISRVDILGRIHHLGATATFATLTLSSTAAAQTAETDSAVVEFINSAAPTVLAYLILFGTVIAVGAHVVSGFPKNPETANRLKDWRNRAAMGVLGAPIMALIIEQMLGFVPIPWLQQIDLVPLV